MCVCWLVVPGKFLAAFLPTGNGVNGSHSENLFIGLSCKIYAALKAANVSAPTSTNLSAVGRQGVKHKVSRERETQTK